ncbi:MAG: hypothetical protein M3Q75_06315 [Gemmatimonadota bacterium]|nr:hypothetical protein [Gemmatimonadota bacterium]
MNHLPASSGSGVVAFGESSFFELFSEDLPNASRPATTRLDHCAGIPTPVS